MKLESFKTNIFELGHKKLFKMFWELEIETEHLRGQPQEYKNIKFKQSRRGPGTIGNEPQSFRFAHIEHLEARAKEISKLDIESVKIKS